MNKNKDVIDNNVPDSFVYRKLYDVATKFIHNRKVLPPVTMEELHDLTDILIDENQELKLWKNWLLVMLNNVIWQDVVASVPFNRRIVLLPKCLRNSRECKAPIDEYGLLCQSCGKCMLETLQNEADSIGTMCLIAEGSAVVAELLDSGSVDAVIGVSCLDALEKSFPYMVKHAIPGIAIPLFSNGCKDTMTDVYMVRDALKLCNNEKYLQFNLPTVLKDVRSWFNEKELTPVLGTCQSQTDIIARNWLYLSGRRFRPFLVVAVANCLGINDYHEDKELKKMAIAVECFHKASLIHDDIEDNDSERYGQPALHEKWGVPIALNIGDLLLGEGYRLISELRISDVKRSLLLNIASTRHLTLCRGQGEEFLSKKNGIYSIENVLKIFQNKTAPAFEVAIMFGLIYGDGDENLYPLINQFSTKLGIAFQILDDLQDESSKNTLKNKTSILRAIEQNGALSLEEARHEALSMYHEYRKQTLHMLRPLENYNLKRLFFQITMRILKDVS